MQSVNERAAVGGWKSNISEVVRIGSIIIFHLSERRKAMFPILCPGEIWNWSLLGVKVLDVKLTPSNTPPKVKFQLWSRSSNKRESMYWRVAAVMVTVDYRWSQSFAAHSMFSVGPYISHMGMCRPKGYHFQAFLVWNRVSILPFWSGTGCIFRLFGLGYHFSSNMFPRTLHSEVAEITTPHRVWNIIYFESQARNR